MRAPDHNSSTSATHERTRTQTHPLKDRKINVYKITQLHQEKYNTVLIESKASPSSNEE